VFTGAPASQTVALTIFVTDAGATKVATVGAPTVVADAAGRGGGTFLLPSGFPAKAGTKLCFQNSAGGVTSAVTAHGFFAKDK